MTLSVKNGKKFGEGFPKTYDRNWLNTFKQMKIQANY